MKSKGITLLIVISSILIIVALANITLTMIRSQATMTDRQVRRIQGFYAAQAGMVYALEMLRTNDANWPVAAGSFPYTRNLCRGCAAPGIDEPSLPLAVTNVAITVDDVEPDGILEIHSLAAY